MILKNKVAVITGGNRGIGRAIAIEFAKEGADVAITYNKNKALGEQVRQEIENIGRKGIAIKCDVSNKKEVEETVKEVLNKFERIDILVNNAGVLMRGELEEMDDRIINETLDTNVKGLIYCTQYVVPIMKKQKYGRIVNISSISAFTNNSSSAIYAGSKAAVLSITRILSKELAEHGITVNAIAPGPVETELMKSADKEKVRWYIENTPMKRIAKPEEVAKAVKFFASDDSSFVTGQTLIVSGGL